MYLCFADPNSKAGFNLLVTQGRLFDRPQDPSAEGNKGESSPGLPPFILVAPSNTVFGNVSHHFPVEGSLSLFFKKKKKRVNLKRTRLLNVKTTPASMFDS